VGSANAASNGVGQPAPRRRWRNVRRCADGLILGGIWHLALILILVLARWQGIPLYRADDPLVFGVILGWCGFVALVNFFAAAMIFARARHGRGVAWVAVVLLLINPPIATLIGCYVIGKLKSHEMGIYYLRLDEPTMAAAIDAPDGGPPIAASLPPPPPPARSVRSTRPR
jgi:hypothetical protein